MKRAALFVAVVLVAAVLSLLLLAHWLWPEPDFGSSRPGPRAASSAPPATPANSHEQAQVERGRYLAIAGDCLACHTERGEPEYAGGRAIPTPFGTFYTPNLTPDMETGLGRWTAEEFWGALHEGRDREGAPLYPSFPYTNYTRITRADANDLFAFLRSLPPVRKPARAHELRFPYAWRPLLIGWRLLFFHPGEYAPDESHSDSWNRGAYLVQGLGHCSACHEARNALGAAQSKDNPAGGLVLAWYAPALDSNAEAGVSGWGAGDIAALLKTGVSDHALTLGPMAEVVYNSLQHLTDTDLAAMADYLRSLPDRPPAPARAVDPKRLEPLMKSGAELYRRECQDCHGANGEGHAPIAPPLAGNRAVSMDSAVDPLRILLFGGYPPGTAGDPRPFGMPPFAQSLSDEEIAAVLTFVRNSWGNHGRPLTAVDVARNRSSPLW
jgi:mono/diheme cytochrome c family protein